MTKKPQRPPYPELMSVPEVALALHLSEDTVHRWVRIGRLDFIDVLGVKRFRRSYIESLLGISDDTERVAS